MQVGHTLESVLRIAALLQPQSRFAILLLKDDLFVTAAEQHLLPPDRAFLQEVAGLLSIKELTSAGQARSAVVRPLLTQAAELVGLLVVFNSNQNESQLDEFCTIATLALEQKNLSEELSYQAHHDSLTHLWNRGSMEEQIEAALHLAARNGRCTALVLIGIDEFRLFNELLGREVGDHLLRLIAARLTEALDPSFVLARVTGDEFLILLPNLALPARALAFASQIRNRFDKPFVVPPHDLIVRASIGVATAQPSECQSNELQNRADQALLYSKRCARGTVSCFSAEMAKTPPERLVMERHLRFALQKREFQLYYQPQVNLLSGNLIGVEALLRWKHPSLGFISPATFIPIAEEIGIIGELGEWVLVEAIRQLEAWQEAGLRNVRMAVNVSPIQFAHLDYATTLAERLRQVPVPPKDLELEITETALMSDLQHGARQFNLLRSLGVQIALDDFGTGHSSLAYLQKLPVDRLKIDRMFIKDIVSSNERPVLLSSIIQMGHRLGCEVIAEGVETVEQALALSAMNCQEAQGFLFSKPIPAHELVKWAASRSESFAGQLQTVP